METSDCGAISGLLSPVSNRKSVFAEMYYSLISGSQMKWVGPLIRARSFQP
jgi:hypothetical protein